MKHGRVPFGILAILIVLLLNLLAASPSLHERLHPDASHADHQCAVTLFAHGKVDAPVVDVVPSVPAISAEFLPLTPVPVFTALVATLPPGRAPPVSLLHS